MATRLHKTILGVMIFGMALTLSQIQAFADKPRFTSKRDYLNSKKKDATIEPSERSCGLYLDQIENVYKGARPTNYFKSIRAMYARCTFYDPFSEDTLRTMAELREQAKGSDPVESAKALRSYKNIVRRHLANLDVVRMALQIAEEDARFGDVQFFREVRSMITESFKTSIQDGSEPSKAIDIVTMGEQDYIIANTDAKLLESEFIDDNGTFYYALDFEASEGKGKFSIFLNVTTPMRVIRARQKEAEKKQNLNVLGTP